VIGMLKRGEIDVITFTSSSTANNFVDLIGSTELGSASVACIGPVTAQTARDRGLRVDTVAEQSTIEGLVDAIVAWHRSQHG
jgi:uroporphyrinogen III methyltransferase/synthase